MPDAVPFDNVGFVAPINQVGSLNVSMNPGRRSHASMAQMPRLELMRACYGGTETMRQMGHVFLPQHERESNERYKHRRDGTFALNKLREAVDAASAKPFRNLLTVDGGDDDLQAFVWNADGRGHHLHVVAHQFFNEAVLTGLSHLLVDIPTTSGLTLAQARAMNTRPYIRRVSPEDLLGSYFDDDNGEQVNVHTRISSSRLSFDRNDFSEKIYDQVFVLERDVVQLWERQRLDPQQWLPTLGAGANVVTPRPIDLRYRTTSMSGTPDAPWTLVAEKRISIPKVPLVSMTAGDEEAHLQVRPIFQDLAYKQIEHWRSSSEQRNILSAGRFPMLAASGIQLDENLAEVTNADGSVRAPAGQGFEIGPWKILTSPDAQGKWYFVEPTGHAIAAGAKDLADLQMQMDLMALNPVISVNRQYVAQNERSIAETRVNSVVHDLAIGCRDALNQSLVLIGLWTGKDYSKARARMNEDYSGTDDKANNINAVLMAVAKGILSREGALHELIRLDLLDEEFDVTAEMGRQTATAELEVQSTMTETTQSTKPPAGARDFPAGKTRPN